MILRKIDFNYEVREMSDIEIKGAIYMLYELAKNINDISIEEIDEMTYYCDKHLYINDVLLIQDDEGNAEYIDSVFCIEGSSELYFNACLTDEDDNFIEDKSFTCRAEYV